MAKTRICGTESTQRTILLSIYSDLKDLPQSDVICGVIYDRMGEYILYPRQVDLEAVESWAKMSPQEQEELKEKYRRPKYSAFPKHGPAELFALERKEARDYKEWSEKNA